MLSTIDQRVSFAVEARPCGCGIEFRSNIKVNKSESEGTSSNNIVVIKCRELSCEHIGDNTRTAKVLCNKTNGVFVLA